ncbi:MAG: XdhC family protein [Eubacteriales bacterium]|nr:XdhC family protein [Eubacteriales bacterium]
MKTLLPHILRELAQGRACALATVLESKGSAPRGAGACMLLMQNGQTEGTVGGGVLEHRAALELKALLDSVVPASALSVDEKAVSGEFPSALQEYVLTQDDVQNLGMVCGGNVSLLYQLLTPELLPFFLALSQKLSEDHNLWLVRSLSDNRVTHMTYVDDVSSPSIGTAIRPYLKRKAQRIALADAASGTLFIEPVLLVSRAYVFGGGHVAQCTAPLLAQLDFAPVVYDDRPEFANEALFPSASGVICKPFSQAAQQLHITFNDEIVIMTRGHQNDLNILTYALRTPAYYIGLIGSRSKIEHTKALLFQQGFTEEDFSRVHTPIGLPIEAETPMEIAVSIAAEMILCRARHASGT